MSLAFLAAAGTTTAPDISIGHLLLQMVVALVLVIGGIWGFGKIMGRSRAAGRSAGRSAGKAAGGFFRPRGHGRPQGQGLTILSRQPVGKGKWIAVVQVGAQQFLVGIGDSGLTPLGELRSEHPETGIDSRPPSAKAPEFGPDDLAHLDLGALGVRPLDLGALPTSLARATESAGRRVFPRPVAPALAAHTGAAESAAQRPVRSLVDALREATVRR